MSSWLLYALLSALCAALVALFGKIGLQQLDANTATAIRAVIIALFLSARCWWHWDRWCHGHKKALFTQRPDYR
ncbi:EamA family transporter [Dickeya oryzae]|uniref:EamA family transporter n=1 Tax=Dickeya oryzae TaxID=1240404 RepID=UPI0024A72D71|nr:EamA family transporter [Dickeya oryzae]